MREFVHDYMEHFFGREFPFLVAHISRINFAAHPPVYLNSDLSRRSSLHIIEGLAQIVRSESVYHLGQQCVTGTFLKQGFRNANFGSW